MFPQYAIVWVQKTAEREGFMRILSEEKGLYGSEIEVFSETQDCIVYRAKNEDGEGFMTSYQVFPGVELIYNDFCMENCFNNKGPRAGIMEINHCRSGRFECEFQNGSCVYMEEGDLAVNMLTNRTKNPCFPQQYYYGVSIVIDLEEAAQTISSLLYDITIDLYALRNKLCANNRCFIVRAKDSIEHIFSELYTAPEEVKHAYFKLKVLELLLFLSTVDLSENLDERQYFHKKQVDTIKAMKEHMVQNLDHHDTLEQLSVRFGISLTAMKSCFKGVYGTSVYAFMRAYRMQAAGAMLLKSTESVTAIASKVGYTNPSKFSFAFKQIMGLSPLEYRKSNCLNKNTFVSLE
jgi:AraC-like DNA-binding protein